MTPLGHLPSLRHAGHDRLDAAIWPLTSAADDVGRLCVGGVPLTDIADEFGTPRNGGRPDHHISVGCAALLHGE